MRQRETRIGSRAVTRSAKTRTASKDYDGIRGDPADDVIPCIGDVDRAGNAIDGDAARRGKGRGYSCAVIVTGVSIARETRDDGGGRGRVTNGPAFLGLQGQCAQEGEQQRRKQSVSNARAGHAIQNRSGRMTLPCRFSDRCAEIAWSGGVSPRSSCVTSVSKSGRRTK